ncbi:hypothetical protein HG547_15395 [Shewanella sp. DNRA4]|uniref:hypothetical protein n=1 Tax=Shewanella sp. DNRA4 TaxID=2723055 RepID=UPI00146A2CAA|nr:hypothetical protein [Shewanella sp. DNRA4]NMD52989.1 hypothetical protein [Shewanella sp. DNRA4]
MQEVKAKENIEWLIEQYKKVKPRPYSGVLIFAGVTILIGPGWWQDIIANFVYSHFLDHISKASTPPASTSVWVGFVLIFIGLTWDLALRHLDKKSSNVDNFEPVKKAMEDKELDERRKWEPVIHKLIHLIERSEGWFYVGFKKLFIPSQENFGLAAHSYKMLTKHLDDLKNLTNNLRSEDMPEFIDILSTLNCLFIKMEFLITMYQDFNPKADYVIHSPANELTELTEKFFSTAAKHNYTIKTEGTDPNLRNDTLSEWKTFCERNPIFDTPSQYQATKARDLIIFDVKTMQEIKTLEPGMMLKIFMTD